MSYYFLSSDSLVYYCPRSCGLFDSVGRLINAKTFSIDLGKKLIVLDRKSPAYRNILLQDVYADIDKFCDEYITDFESVLEQVKLDTNYIPQSPREMKSRCKNISNSRNLAYKAFFEILFNLTKEVNSMADYKIDESYCGIKIRNVNGGFHWWHKRDKKHFSYDKMASKLYEQICKINDFNSFKNIFLCSDDHEMNLLLKNNYFSNRNVIINSLNIQTENLFRSDEYSAKLAALDFCNLCRCHSVNFFAFKDNDLIKFNSQWQGLYQNYKQRT